MKKKPTFEVKPVAWQVKEVTKIQASAAYQVGEERTIRILSDPMETEEEANKNLKEESRLWKLAIDAIYYELWKEE